MIGLLEILLIAIGLMICGCCYSARTPKGDEREPEGYVSNEDIVKYLDEEVLEIDQEEKPDWITGDEEGVSTRPYTPEQRKFIDEQLAENVEP